MVSYLDKIVGQIADEIDRLGLSDNTIIIFTGDNGTDRRLTSRYRDRMVPGGKATMTDTGVRVPFIVRQTGRTARRSSTSAISCPRSVKSPVPPSPRTRTAEAFTSCWTILACLIGSGYIMST